MLLDCISIDMLNSVY